MYSSSPPYQCPSTPSKSSPLVAAQARRRSQYKALILNTPQARRTQYKSLTPDTPVPRRIFSRCLERAVKARAQSTKGKRRANEPSSDDFSMNYDEDDDDEVIMQDELFRRIMANATRKERHSYRVSYAQEVGSSFDPDLEDVTAWEEDCTTTGASTLNEPLTDKELTPVDLDDEEIEAYAEEYAQRAALADFDDIPEKELFSWSDFEETDEPTLDSKHQMKPQFDGYEMDIA